MTADARKVKQIVYNLLSNAVKFIADGGHVTLRADRVTRDDVGVLTGPWAGANVPTRRQRRSRNTCKLSVTDDGIGMSPERLEHLFKPFSQVDSSLARQFEGTGLGLAMVKLLADLHGGAVAVESAVGEGSRFTVWIPMRTSKTSRSSRRKYRRRRRRTRCPDGARTALVVECNDESAELIRVQLEAEGFTVIHATSADAAIAVAEKTAEPLALVTLDVMMPDADGWMLLEKTQEHPAIETRSGGDHLDSRRPHQGLRDGRGGGDAVTGVATGVVRLARRAGTARPRPPTTRRKCSSSTTIRSRSS